MRLARSKPLVIGHRGASGTEPENTLRSFAMAAKMGADGIELDIFRTADGKVVVTHNNDTALLTNEKMIVRKSTLRDLKTLDFGKKERIPTLDDVFDAFLKKFSIINVEIKSTGFRTDGIEALLVGAIRRFRCEGQVLVSSFNPLNLVRFRRLLPEVPIGYLLCPQQSVIVRNRRVIARLKPNTLNLDQNLFDVKKYAPFFMYPRIWLWTVNTLEAMEHFAQMRVEAIITNYPDKLRKVVDL
jgi:glycerophosphoryl diester phosphodiesterase